MILQQMSEEEISRIAPLVETTIPKVEEQIGLPRKFIREVLIVSSYFLIRERDKIPVPLNRFIDKHCRRIASDMAVSMYDVREVFETWVRVILTTSPGR